MSKTFIAIVGKEEKKKKAFTLYTDVATHSSKFFQAALSIDPPESQHDSVTLTEVSAVEFDYYLQWLSTHDRSFLSDINSSQLAKLYYSATSSVTQLSAPASSTTSSNTPSTEAFTLTIPSSPRLGSRRLKIRRCAR
jgi:hypothetical protein